MIFINKISNLFNLISEETGRVISATTLLLILVQFAIVVMMSVFHQGSIQLQESLQYINALMFLTGAGYTLKTDDHVRVDLFYAGFTQRTKDWVNLIGTLVLLLPFIGLVWVAGLPFVLDSWSSMEGSVESSGLPYVYLLKSTILLFAVSLTLQAIANIIDISARLRTKEPT